MENQQPEVKDFCSYSSKLKRLIEEEKMASCYEYNANIKCNKIEDEDQWIVEYRPGNIERIKRTRRKDRFTIIFESISDGGATHPMCVRAYANQSYFNLFEDKNYKGKVLNLIISKTHNCLLEGILDNPDCVYDQNNEQSRLQAYAITIVNESKKVIFDKKREAVDRMDKEFQTWKYFNGVQNRERNEDAESMLKLLLHGIDAFVDKQLMISNDPRDKGYVDNCALNLADIVSKGLPSMTDMQNRAIDKILGQRLTLIYRPIRMSYSVYATDFAYGLFGLLSKLENCSEKKILICCRSNKVVYEIAKTIHDQGNVKVVTVRSEYEKEKRPDFELALDFKIKQFPQLRDMMSILENDNEVSSEEGDDSSELPGSNKSEFDKIKLLCEREVMMGADIVCSTLTSSSQFYEQKFYGLKFNTIIITDSLASESDCLVPVTLWPSRLVFIGEESRVNSSSNNDTIPLFDRLRNQLFMDGCIVNGDSPSPSRYIPYSPAKSSYHACVFIRNSDVSLGELYSFRNKFMNDPNVQYAIVTIKTNADKPFFQGYIRVNQRQPSAWFENYLGNNVKVELARASDLTNQKSCSNGGEFIEVGKPEQGASKNLDFS